MPTPFLPDYLRAYRRKSGLTQREVAFLLGIHNGAQVSRYEKRHRVPPLPTALAFEAVFGIPVGELFAGVKERIAQDVERRLKRLAEQLENSKTTRSSKALMIATKLQWLAGRLNGRAAESHE